MPTESRLLASYTDDDIVAISRLNPHVRLERDAEGELHAFSVVDEVTARRVSVLCMQLAVWYGEYRSGELFDFSTGFHFGEEALLFADAAWVERDRWKWLSERERRSFPPVCPSVAFEVLMPGESRETYRERAGMFLAGGARAVVLIDAGRRSTDIYRAHGVDAYGEQREVRVVELGYFTLEPHKIFG